MRKRGQVRDIKGEEVLYERGRTRSKPFVQVLDGREATEILEGPEQPYSTATRVVVDFSDTPAGRRGRSHEFHHLAYTDHDQWAVAVAAGVQNDCLQKCEDVRIQTLANRSGFKGYAEAIYTPEEWADLISRRITPDRMVMSAVALGGTADLVDVEAAMEAAGMADHLKAARRALARIDSQATANLTTAYAAKVAADLAADLAALAPKVPRIEEALEAAGFETTEEESTDISMEATSDLPEDADLEPTEEPTEEPEGRPMVPPPAEEQDDPQEPTGQPQIETDENPDQDDPDGFSVAGDAWGPDEDLGEATDELDEDADLDQDSLAMVSGMGWQPHEVQAYQVPEGLRGLFGFEPEELARERAAEAGIDRFETMATVSSEDATEGTLAAWDWVNKTETPVIPEPGQVWYRTNREAIERARESFEAFKTSRALTEIRRTRKLSMGWGYTVIQRVPLTRSWPGSWRRPKFNPQEVGAIPGAIHRLPVDQKIFTDTRTKSKGGTPTILVDVSGSMSLSVEQVSAICEAHPYATVATYSGGNTSGAIVIIAKGGRVAEQSAMDLSQGGNGIDGPALRWLGSQPGPRIWVSDGQVFGRMSSGSRRAYKQVATLKSLADCCEATIAQDSIKHVAEPCQVTTYLAACQRKGKTFIRDWKPAGGFSPSISRW